MVDLNRYGVQKEKGTYHQDLVYTVALLYNVLSTDMNNYLAKFDLSIGKLNILIAVQRYGGDTGVKQVEVSHHLIVTPSNMTKMIDRMEKDGLVRRLALEGDRRVKILKTTIKGRDLINQLWDGYQERLKSATDVLPKQKQKLLADLLTEWLSGVKE